MRRALLAGWIVCAMWATAAVAEEQAKAKPAEPAKPAAKAKDAATAKAAAKPQEAAKKASEKPATKTVTVAEFTIRGGYAEGPQSDSLFGEMQPSLADLIRRIEQAGEDKDVAAAVLRIEDAALGRGKLHELRAAIARFRKSGKPIYALLTSGETAEYLLATACDRVIMPSSGVLMVPGVRAEVTFYKGLFDKLGIQAEMLQMGKYKGAGEPYTRSGMSPELRENLGGVVDDFYDDMVATIAKDRKMEDYRVKTLIDDGLFTAAAAKKAGLIDEVAYADQFLDSLKKELKADEVKVVANYKKKKVDTDFSGLSGFMKMLNLILGTEKPAETGGKEKKIAVVYAVGMIVPGKSGSSLFGGEVLGSTTLVEALRKAADDPNVLAIVLRIDSPGGSALASDLIWRETVRTKKPIIASMGDVAGSGGYYIAMGAQKIIAEPGTVTGSIGVVGGKLATAGLFEKIGVTSEVISRGKISGALSSDKPFTPEERAALVRLLEETYRQFVGKAAQGRKMPREKLESLAQGRIYTGRMAAANGLVDAVGTLADAVAEAKKAAGLKPDDKVELMVLPKPRTIFEQLFGDGAISDEMEGVLPGAGGLLRKARALRQLFAERTLTWMPFEVQVK